MPPIESTASDHVRSENFSAKPVCLPWFDDVTRMLDVSRLVLLVGPSGCGKSTFAQHISRQQTGRPPIVIPGSPQREEIDIWGVAGSFMVKQYSKTALFPRR